MNCVLGQKETLKQKKAQCTISRQHAQIFPGPQRNARGARPWWPPESKGRSLTPNANGMTEATGVKTEF